MTAQADYDFALARENNYYAQALKEWQADDAFDKGEAISESEFQTEQSRVRNAFRNQVAALVLDHADELDHTGFVVSGLDGYAELNAENISRSQAASDRWRLENTSHEGERLAARGEALEEFVSGYETHWLGDGQLRANLHRDYDLAIADLTKDREIGFAAARLDHEVAVSDSLVAVTSAFAASTSSPWSNRTATLSIARDSRDAANSLSRFNYLSAQANDERQLQAIAIEARYDLETASHEYSVDRWSSEMGAEVEQKRSEGGTLVAWSETTFSLIPTIEEDMPEGGVQTPQAPGTAPSTVPRPHRSRLPVEPDVTKSEPFDAFSFGDEEGRRFIWNEYSQTWEFRKPTEPLGTEFRMNPKLRGVPLSSGRIVLESRAAFGYPQLANMELIHTEAEISYYAPKKIPVAQPPRIFYAPPTAPREKPPQDIDEAVYFNEDGSSVGLLEMPINQFIFRIQHERWPKPMSGSAVAHGNRLANQKFYDFMASENAINKYEGTGIETKVLNVGVDLSNGVKNVGVQFANGIYFNSVPELNVAAERLAKSARDRGAIGAQVVYGTADIAGKATTVAFVITTAPIAAVGATEMGIGGTVGVGNVVLTEGAATTIAGGGQVVLEVVGVAYGVMAAGTAAAQAKEGDFYHATINFGDAALTVGGVGYSRYQHIRSAQAATEIAEYRLLYAKSDKFGPGRYFMTTAEGETVPLVSLELGAPKSVLSRGEQLRQQYSHLTPAQRVARIDELSNANYLRRLDEKLGSQEYVFRYLTEDGLATSYKYNSVRGYTTTEFSGSAAEVARRAQVLADWSNPALGPATNIRYGVAIPVNKVPGYRLARPLGDSAELGWEFTTHSYPTAGPGGWTQFLIEGVPLEDVYIFTLR